jgi:hypothetical protein
MSSTLRHVRVLLPVVAALAATACGGGDVVLPSEGVAAKIVVVSGNTQAGVVGATLVDSLIVRVTDSKDRPVQGQQVTFTAGDANSGQPVPPTSTTNADGRAGVKWVLGTVAGAQTMVAKPTGNGAPASLSVTFTATASSAVPTKMDKVAGDGQTASAGTAVATAPAVKLTDANGNPVAGVGVTFQVTGGGGTVVPTTPVATNASGIATATSWTLGATAGPNQLTAGVTAASVTGNPAVFSATGVVGGANRLVFTVQPVNAAVGAPITPAVQVQVQDASGNPVTTATNPITVAFGTNPTGAALGGTTTVNAINGTATFSTLTVDRPGTGYTLTALSSGLTTATSTAFSVVAASSTTTITNINPSSTVVGQPYTVSFTVTVAPPASGTPTGTVTVSDGTGTAPCTGSAPNGSCSLTSTTAGTKSVIATYAGDANFAGGASAPVSHTVNPAGTTIVINSETPDPSVFGQAVTVTYTVTVNSPGSGTPAGIVAVTWGGGSPVCSQPLAAGNQCVFTPSSTGTKNLRATFTPSSGDFSGDQSPNVAHTVDQAATTTALAPSANPSSFGQSVFFTATVTANAAGAATPTGAVQFKIDGSNFGSAVLLASGSAQSQSTSTLTPGDHSVQAVYNPDAGFTGSNVTITQTVNGVIPTGTALAPTPNPSVFGQSVTLTATVTSSLLTPTGNVDFRTGSSCSGGASLGTPAVVPASAGTATATVNVSSLPVGMNQQLVACYLGNGTFGASHGGATQTVNKQTTTTVVALTSGTNPSNAGDPLTFTATVSAAVGTPTGTVTFNNGSCGGGDLAGGPQPLVSGQASFSTSALPGGATTTTIFACYDGDANDLISSGSVDQTVN